MSDDAQLLREYVEHRSERAFAEFVRRHLGLVYHSAVRQLGGESHLAEDVAQSVFVLVAAKSRSLLAHPCLAAWLHTATHFKVAEVLRSERRRRTREAAAQLVKELMDNEAADDWEHLRPLVDEALLELGERDREAVLLRFFQDRPYAEIAARLRLSENTAHKRVERALEKLRERLARRGVTSTAAALATVLGEQAALAAPPAGLAAAVTGTVISSGLPVVAGWSALSLMTTKTATAAAVVAMVIAGGVGTQQVIAERDAAGRLITLERENAALAARLRASEQRRARQAVAERPVPARAVAAQAQPQTAAVARALGTGGLASIEESRAFLRANPELQDALAAYHRETLGDDYADLIAALGLAPQEREQFLAILASGMRRIVGEHQLVLADSDVSGAEIARQLRELLGEARYQLYRDYRGSGVQRDLTQEMVRSLYFTPTPLTPAQSTELKQILARALANSTLGPKYTGGAWSYLPGAVWERLINDAAPLLAPGQVDALRELQQRSRFHHAQAEAAKAYRARQGTARQPKN